MRTLAAMLTHTSEVVWGVMGLFSYTPTYPLSPKEFQRVSVRTFRNHWL